MRTPANSTKQFMNELINTINLFFRKVSKNQIQFRLSEHYSLAKKNETGARTKLIQKQAKDRNEDNAEKAKILKKAYKKYRVDMMKNESLLKNAKDSSERERKKYLKAMWKNIPESQKLKWAESSKRKEMINNKLKSKGVSTKIQAKIQSKNQVSEGSGVKVLSSD